MRRGISPYSFNEYVLKTYLKNGKWNVKYDLSRHQVHFDKGFLNRFYGGTVLAYRGLCLVKDNFTGVDIRKIKDTGSLADAIISIDLEHAQDWKEEGGDSYVDFSLNPCLSANRFTKPDFAGPYNPNWLGVFVECELPLGNIKYHDDSVSGPIDEAGIRYYHHKDESQHWSNYVKRGFIVSPNKINFGEAASEGEIKELGLSKFWSVGFDKRDGMPSPSYGFLCQASFPERYFAKMPHTKYDNPSDLEKFSYEPANAKKQKLGESKWYRIF